jgi:hypothetical protein
MYSSACQAVSTTTISVTRRLSNAIVEWHGLPSVRLGEDLHMWVMPEGCDDFVIGPVARPVIHDYDVEVRIVRAQ